MFDGIYNFYQKSNIGNHMINSTYICVCIIYECVRYTWVYYVMGLVFWIHVPEDGKPGRVCEYV